MSVLGQKRTLDWRLLMSALPPKADMAQHDCDVRFVPKADKCTAAYLPAYWRLILTQLVERLEY
jgi:hypothetical protein